MATARRSTTEKRADELREAMQQSPEIRALISDELSRAFLASDLGMTFGGVRNNYEILGYPQKISAAKYRERYERGDIAERLVEAKPEATWRTGVALVDDEDTDVESPFEKVWLELETRLQIWPIILQADILAGLGRYSVIFIGAPGANLAEPLTAPVMPQAITYLRAFSEEQAKIETFDEDLNSTRFGLPLAYNIRVTDSTRAAKVHWTRTVHVAEGLLSSRVYGKPRLRAVWNRLEDLDKIIGGGAEATWNSADPGFEVKLDENANLTPAQKTALDDQLSDYRHKRKRWIRTKGLSLNPLSGLVPPIGPNADAVLDLIAATSGIPKRLLLGSEVAERASSQDRSNWHERIRDRRSRFGEPIARALPDRFIELKVLPPPKSGKYELQWPEIEALTDMERAEIANQWMSTNDHGEITVFAEEVRDRILDLPPRADANPDFVDPLLAGDPEDDEEDEDDAEDEGEIVEDDEEDEEPDEEARAAVRALRAVAGVNAMREVFERSFVKAGRSVDVGLLANALEARDNTRAEIVVVDAVRSTEDALLASAEEALFASLVAGARRSAKRTRTRVQVAQGAEPVAQDVKIGITFDLKNVLARDWAAKKSARLVREISRETRAAIRQVIARAFDEGLAPRTSARLIRDLVGLTRKQTQAVANLRTELREAKVGKVVTREGFKAKVPKGPRKAFLDKATKKYRDKLHRERALTIARTETLAAENEGTRQLWKQAADKGLISEHAQREWIVTPDDRLCSVCSGLDGEIVGLEDDFSIGVSAPPAHPRCRCDVLLVNA